MRLSLELGYEAIGLPREGPRGPRALCDRARKPWGKAPEKVAQRPKGQLKARRPKDDGPQEGSRRASRRLEAEQRPKGQLMHRACGPHAVPAPSRMLVRAGRWVERVRLSRGGWPLRPHGLPWAMGRTSTALPCGVEAMGLTSMALPRTTCGFNDVSPRGTAIGRSH